MSATIPRLVPVRSRALRNDVQRSRVFCPAALLLDARQSPDGRLAVQVRC